MGLPIPNLDDKTFDEIVQEARSLISRYAPEWTDHNVHDPGITFIELFAWLAEMQIYQLNQITDAHYQKFLKLVGFHPFDYKPAQVNITFENVTAEKTINPGDRLETDMSGDQIVFEAEEQFTLVPVTLKAVKTTYDSKIIDNAKANKEEDIHFYIFGETAPAGATLELGFDKPFPEKEIKITFELYEEDLDKKSCKIGSHGNEPEQVSPPVTLVWEYWNDGWSELVIKEDTTLSLTRSGKIVFDGPASMKEKDGSYWLRCRLADRQYEIIPQIERILLNTVSAIQIETIADNFLGQELDTPEHKVQLTRKPVIKRSQKIFVQNKEWIERDDLESSGPDDPHYMFNPENGEITFGNGLNGRIPSKTHTIMATYKTTTGSKGNIHKGQIFRINKAGFEGIKGINWKDATGGEDTESVDDAQLRARKDFRTPYRAITSDDYERLALSTPGLRVARAKALPNYWPDYPCVSMPDTVTVVIVPCTREKTVTPVPGEGFLRTILNHLEMHRLVTTKVYVVGPEYVKVSVKCKVRIKKRSAPDKVKERVQKAIEDFLDPLKGGQDGNGWPFGRSVFPSEIYDVIDKVEGVDYASNVSLMAEGNYRKDGEVIKISPIALVFSGEHKVETI